MDNRYVQQFKKGSLEMILLCLIGRKETYGYEIITELNNSASVLGYAKEGTIYPILYRLQEAELIQCRLAPAAANGGSKKYFCLLECVIYGLEALVVGDVFDKRLDFPQTCFNAFQFLAGTVIGAVNILDLLLTA